MGMCTDYRRVNILIKPDSFAIATVDDLIDSIVNSKFISKTDLLKGCYQVPISDKAHQVSDFLRQMVFINIM